MLLMGSRCSNTWLLTFPSTALIEAKNVDGKEMVVGGEKNIADRCVDFAWSDIGLTSAPA